MPAALKDPVGAAVLLLPVAGLAARLVEAEGAEEARPAAATAAVTTRPRVAGVVAVDTANWIGAAAAVLTEEAAAVRTEGL